MANKTTTKTTAAPTRQQIARWMRDHKAEHADRLTGEVNLTALVEAWDRACADGGATRDPEHVAWEIAVDVAG